MTDYDFKPFQPIGGFNPPPNPNSTHAPSVVPVAKPIARTKPEAKKVNSVRRAAQFAEPISPQGLLLSLKRVWKPASVTAIPVALVAMAVAWFILPAHYSAFALLRIAAIEPRMVFKTAEESSDFPTYVKTQQALLKSRFVLNAALRRPGIADLQIVRNQKFPLEWLEKAITVDTYNSPEILRISLAGDQPDELAKVVNAVKDSYMEECVLAERKQRIARLSDLERIYGDTEKKVRAKEERSRNLAKQLGSGDSKALTIKQQMALEDIARLRREHAEVRAAVRREQLRGSFGADLSIGNITGESASKKSNGKSSSGGSSIGLLGDDEDADPRVAAVERRIASLKQLIAKYETQVVDANHPTLQHYREELGTLQKALTSGIATNQEGEQEVAHTRLDFLKKQEVMLREELEKYSQTVKEMGASSYELELMQSEIDQVAKVSDRVGTEMETLRIELQCPTRVTLMQEADVPQVRDMGRKKSLATAAGFGGCGIVVLIFALIEFHTRRITDPRDVSQTLALDLLGTLPAMPTGGLKFWAKPKAARVAMWNNALIESVDSVRAILMHGEDGVRRQVILVASANPGEGKTTFACQLAGSLARAGQKTLLIDFDVRRPRVHQLMQTPLELGICELLTEKLILDTVIHHTAEANLDVIPAGKVNEDALQALAKDGADWLFKEVRKDYEFVIVDCAPVLYAADGGAIGRNVDGAILAVRSHASRLPVVAVACERLEMLGIDLIGAVMVGVQTDFAGYGYQYEVQHA